MRYACNVVFDKSGVPQFHRARLYPLTGSGAHQATVLGQVLVASPLGASMLVMEDTVAMSRIPQLESLCGFDLAAGTCLCQNCGSIALLVVSEDATRTTPVCENCSSYPSGPFAIPSG